MKTKTNKQAHLKTFAVKAIAFGAIISAALITLADAFAGCGSKNPDNNCGNVATFTCVLTRYTVPCRTASRTATVCNPTYKEYTHQNQWKCTSENVGVNCVEAADNCGYVMQGSCVPDGSTNCVLRSAVSIGGNNILEGEQHTFTTTCFKANGGPDPTPVSGGKIATTSSDPGCLPTPTPTPTPPTE